MRTSIPERTGESNENCLLYTSFAVTADTAEIAGDDLVEAECPGVVYVVVHHVHDHAQAVVVERLDHPLHLRHTDSAVKPVSYTHPRMTMGMCNPKFLETISL